MCLKMCLLLMLLLTSHVFASEQKQDIREHTKEAIAMCKKKCNCSPVEKTIKCSSIQNLWFLATEGEKFADEFADFSVIVSDNTIKKIDKTCEIKSGHCNGLGKIKGLTLSSFKKLEEIQPTFFEKYFPNLNYLTVTESENELSEITIGRLPSLKILQVNGANIKRVLGCDDEHRYCFREDGMEFVQLPTLNLKNIGLPNYINDIKIDLNNGSKGNGDMDVFVGKRVNKLTFIISKLTPFPPMLYDVEVMKEFFFEIPQIHDELQLWALMVSLQEQPSLVSRMNLKMKTSHEEDLKFPVIMKSCEDCDFESIARVAEYNGVCFEEQNYLDTFNMDLPVGYQKNRNLTIRGIYVDVESLLDTLDGDSTFHVTIYAYVAKVPKTKFVNFDLKVYYAALQNKVAELSQVITIRPPYTMVKYEDTFGAPITYAKKVDALFVHAYSLCVAKLTASFMKDTPEDRFTESVSWRMFSNLPSVSIYSTCNEVLTNSRMSAIQGLLSKHTYMFVDRLRSINRLPYLYKDTQEEFADILIQSAGMISKKKSDFRSRKTTAQILNQDALHIKNILDDEDAKQIQLMETEKEKAMELARITLRRKVIQKVQLDSIKQVLEEELSEFDDIEQNLKDKAETFINGASNRDATGWAKIISQLTKSILSLINKSRFDYDEVEEKALKGDKLTVKLLHVTDVAKEIYQLMKEMEAISFTYSNVRDIIQMKLRVLKKKLKDANPSDHGKEKNYYSGMLKRMSKGLASTKDLSESVTMLYKSKDSSVKDLYDSEVGSLAIEGLNIVKRQSKIKAKDIIKWDVLKDKIKCLLDKDLILGIPESGEYLATLLDMIERAKTITQLKLDQSKLITDIILADKSYWGYIEESAALEKGVGDINKAKQARGRDSNPDRLKEEYKGHYMQTEKYIYYITFINKLRVIDAHKEFCQGYYYHYLRKCPEDYNIDIFTPLEEVIAKYQILVQDNSIQTLQFFETAPQPFESFSITIKKEENCKCVITPYDELRNVESDRNVTENDKSKFETSSKQACFPHQSRSITTQEILDKLTRCKMQPLNDLILHNSISIEVPANYKEDFTSYERVRVDEIKVHISGVTTANGKVVMTITNAGIIQDRHKGEVFNFYGLPRVQKYEYCGENIKESEENKEPPLECQRKHKTIVSASVYDEFKESDIKTTLFSTWLVRVPEGENKGLDLSDVESIEIMFSGSLISGHTDYSKYSMTEQLEKNDPDKGSNTFIKDKVTLAEDTEKEYPIDEDKYHIYEYKK